MDYTDLDRVKAALGATEDADDVLLEQYITAASRAIDRHCGGADATDYFAGRAVADELHLNAAIDRDGALRVWPRAPRVSAVASLSWRASIQDNWHAVGKVFTDGHQVYGMGGLPDSRRVQAKVTYTGGYGATVDDLPADIVEVATMLAVRFYREAKSGLQDIVGVTEMGTLMYVKAWPVRALEMMKPYRRVTP